jgi:hypothetical protein
MRFPRAALAATVLATGLSTFAGTAHATDNCNDAPSDRNIEITNVVRVGIDDPTTGIPGVVVVCLGIAGDREFTQVGGGVSNLGSGGPYTIILCLPDCHPFP